MSRRSLDFVLSACGAQGVILLLLGQAWLAAVSMQSYPFFSVCVWVRGWCVCDVTQRRARRGWAQRHRCCFNPPHTPFFFFSFLLDFTSIFQSVAALMIFVYFSVFGFASFSPFFNPITTTAAAAAAPPPPPPLHPAFVSSTEQEECPCSVPFPSPLSTPPKSTVGQIMPLCNHTAAPWPLRTQSTETVIGLLCTTFISPRSFCFGSFLFSFSSSEKHGSSDFNPSSIWPLLFVFSPSNNPSNDPGLDSSLGALGYPSVANCVPWCIFLFHFLFPFRPCFFLPFSPSFSILALLYSKVEARLSLLPHHASFG